MRFKRKSEARNPVGTTARIVAKFETDPNGQNIKTQRFENLKFEIVSDFDMRISNL